MLPDNDSIPAYPGSSYHTDDAHKAGRTEALDPGLDDL